MAEFDLVFEGGGAKGMVFAGALEVFAERGHTPRRLLGTSAGAITATCLAAGYSAAEMVDVMSETDANGKPRFASFMDTPEAFSKATIEDSLLFDIFRDIDVPLIPQWAEDKADRAIFNRLNQRDRFRRVFSFIERGGLYKGDAFIDWLKEKLGDKNPEFATATLGQFYEKTKVDLSMVVSDTTSQDMRVLNHRTTPDIPVANAVRMTMSIPFVWQEVCWKEAWGRYREVSEAGEPCETNITNHIFVDGGLLSNFPLEYLTDDTPDITAVMGERPATDAGIIGFLIDETLDVPNAPPAPAADEVHVESRVVNRIRRLVDTMTGAHDKRVMAAHPGLVCRLPAKGYGTTEFDMNEDRRNALIAAGRSAMEQYFNQ